jgi:hypothetical protein
MTRTPKTRSSSRAALQDLGLHGHCCLWLHRAGRVARTVPEAVQEIHRLVAVWCRSRGAM